MTHSRTSRELPFASTSLLSDQERIARAILKTKIDPELFAESAAIIKNRIERVKRQSEQLDRSFDSAIRLCQIDYRRNVDQARKLHPDKERRAHLIQLHTESYKVACMYACRRYKDNLKLVIRIKDGVQKFMDDNQDRIIKHD